MGLEVRDSRLFFTSLSGHVSLPLRNKTKDWGCVEYNDQSKQVRLLDENGDVIAHVKLKNITRKEWLLDSPVDSVIDWDDRVYVMTGKGRAVELFFNAEEGENEDGEGD